MGSLGWSLDAKRRCRLAVISVSGGIAGEFAQLETTVILDVQRFAQREGKSPVLTLSENTSKAAGLSHTYFQSHLIHERDLRATFAHICQFQFDLYQTLLSESACLFVECSVLLTTPIAGIRNPQIAHF
jgi:hypothetical protein